MADAILTAVPDATVAEIKNTIAKRIIQNLVDAGYLVRLPGGQIATRQ